MMSSIIILDPKTRLVIRKVCFFRSKRLILRFYISQSLLSRQFADVAQVVEQLIRNQQVSGSIPLVGSNEGRHDIQDK